MLLAKIRDVLLNRRNKVEIESLQGEVDVSHLSPKGNVELDGNLKAKDINVNGITSKGIANTGGFANIGDVAISGDLDVQGESKGKITANTLEQRNANWTLPITSWGTFGGLTGTVSFARIQKVNQELEIVVSLVYENNTENNISAYGTTAIDIELPEDIAEKIYDINGVSVKSNTSDNVYIASSMAYASKSKGLDASKITGQPRLILLNISQHNKLRITFNSPSSLTAEANGLVMIEGRIQLTLI